jgi:tRNA U34 2-thiouridine synthase MnmA/TrmU
MEATEPGRVLRGTMQKKAVSLISGGLDSLLATKLIKDQGIEVKALHFTSPFCNCTHGGKKGCGVQAVRSSEELGVEVAVKVKGAEYLKMLQAPLHGYGSHMNPCIDCRIFMLRETVKFMEEVGASFVVTGEVLGQRPMSQRREAMRIIDKESGLEGLIVRPLSAQHFPPTLPEKEGIIDRKKLLNLSGRSRKEQYRLAKEQDLKEYSCPAGGCLLTDPIFAVKLRDLFRFNPDCTMFDAALLKIGRHFRLSETTKLILGRNEEENGRLEALSRAGHPILKPISFVGPSGLLVGAANEEAVPAAANIMASYSKSPEFPVIIEVINGSPARHTIDRLSLNLDQLKI